MMQEPLPDFAAPSLLVEPQRNQTIEHWWLAWAGRQYLLGQRMDCIAMEVALWHQRPIVPDDPKLADYTVQVGVRVDLLAITRRYDAEARSAMPILTDEGWESVTIAVEAKANRPDFRRGFNANVADFNYVICPKGLVQPSELPGHVGLLEHERGTWMRRRAKRVEHPDFDCDTAVWCIAAACAREVRRMRPSVSDPFAEEGPS